MPDGGELYLDPQRAIAGGRDLAAAGKDLVDRRNGIGADIIAASSQKPWGMDDIGAAFDQQYAPMEAKLMEAWLRIAEYVEGLGEAAVASVNDNLHADAEASTRVIDAYKKH
ncbi:hypothetical protein [Actinoplanes sp. NPDC051494]|uniref:hypothetical protein n=1 Tax=Actinoplanes sp. NPDC051494 TaxID=3363907 RepID=UPI0037B52406